LLLLPPWFFAPPLYADLSSANYRADLKETAGGGSSSSASYALSQGEVDWSKKDLVTSANYKAQGQIALGASDLLVPEIQSVNPGNLSRFFTDQNASYTVTASDPDSDTLQYQARQDGTVKVAFQASNALSYALAAGDKGRHKVKFEVQDNDGTVALEQDSYFFRRPVK
jgi:hypothetical protein